MSDLEMTRLCAEAMGWKHLGAAGVSLTEAERRMRNSEIDERYKGQLWCLSGQNDWWLDPEGHHVCGPCTDSVPDPLKNDSQAMALVKRFDIELTRGGEMPEKIRWWAQIDIEDIADSADLNRAIVSCVAQMQSAKAKP